MEAIERYIERLAEPGMREYLRKLHWVDETLADQAPARPGVVRAAERKLGVRLPPSYKRLVTTFGPYDAGFQVYWIEDPHGLGADIVHANRPRLAPGLIALMPFPNGDTLCFDTRARDERGEYPIVHFDHEIHSQESTEFEVCFRDLGDMLLRHMPAVVPPDAVERARSSVTPGTSLTQKARRPWRRLRPRIRRLARAISTGIAALRSDRAPRSKPRAERSPLAAAIDEGDLQKASALLAAGADPNAGLPGAIDSKSRDMIRLLIQHGADPRAIDGSGRNSLQRAFEREPELAVWLFDQLPDATVLDAAEAGASDGLRRLVEAGGDVNMVSQDVQRFSPLQAAVLRRDLEMATYLLDRGADQNYRGGWNASALMIAATSAYSAELTAMLLRRGADPNTTDYWGRTALHCVASTCWIDVLEALLTASADVDSRTPDGSTPLHEATRNTDAETRAIRILCQHGANLNARDNRGLTPLHVAMEKSMANAAQALLDLGADPTIRDAAGRTPVELVHEAVREYPGIPEVVRRLNSWVRPTT